MITSIRGDNNNKRPWTPPHDRRNECRHTNMVANVGRYSCWLFWGPLVSRKMKEGRVASQIIHKSHWFMMFTSFHDARILEGSLYIFYIPTPQSHLSVFIDDSRQINHPGLVPGILIFLCEDGYGCCAEGWLQKYSIHKYQFAHPEQVVEQRTLSSATQS